MTRSFRSLRGLRYIPNYLSVTEQDELLNAINASPWVAEEKRRIQHYGWRASARTRRIEPEMYLGALPEWVKPLAERVHRDGLIESVPDQVVINEYEPGQGIAGHIDHLHSYGGSILSVSLISPCVMIFTHPHSKERISILLEPGSLLVLQGDSRTSWRHGILPRKNDMYQGQVIRRERRVSVTFRKVLADPPPVYLEHDLFQWQPTIA
jgi:alkylated DNA repair dioxygenase AlkB